MTVLKLLQGKGDFVPAIRSNAHAQEVIEQLETDDAGALIVTDDLETILGIVSERDIVRGLKKYGRDAVDKPVRDLMTKAVISCDIGQPVTRILELMDQHQIRHVPITRAGKLCGIITLLDVVKFRLKELEFEATVLKDYVAGHA